VSARLVIDGEVAAPQSLDFAALRALGDQLVEPSALLSGREIVAVRLETLLALARVNEHARSLVFESSEGSYVHSMTLEAVRGCVVIYRVGEAPLPRGLGGPLRLVTQAPARCGDIKALATIHVSEHAHIDDADTERWCLRTATTGRANVPHD